MPAELHAQPGGHAASQTAAFRTRDIADDDGYTEPADSLSEGERLACILGDKHIMLMKNHGVLGVGDNVGQAYRRLFVIDKSGRIVFTHDSMSLKGHITQTLKAVEQLRTRGTP